jgi:hypothetical protein
MNNDDLAAVITQVPLFAIEAFAHKLGRRLPDFRRDRSSTLELHVKGKRWLLSEETRIGMRDVAKFVEHPLFDGLHLGGCFVEIR